MHLRGENPMQSPAPERRTMRRFDMRLPASVRIAGRSHWGRTVSSTAGCSIPSSSMPIWQASNRDRRLPFFALAKGVRIEAGCTVAR